jgi:hypothetical protein
MVEPSKAVSAEKLPGLFVHSLLSLSEDDSELSRKEGVINVILGVS